MAVTYDLLMEKVRARSSELRTADEMLPRLASAIRLQLIHEMNMPAGAIHMGILKGGKFEPNNFLLERGSLKFLLRFEFFVPDGYSFSADVEFEVHIEGESFVIAFGDSGRTFFSTASILPRNAAELAVKVSAIVEAKVAEFVGT